MKSPAMDNYICLNRTAICLVIVARHARWKLKTGRFSNNLMSKAGQTKYRNDKIKKNYN